MAFILRATSTRGWPSSSLLRMGGESLLDVLDGSGLGDGGISITTGLGGEGAVEGGLKGDKEVVLVHLVVHVGGDSDGEGGAH